MVTIGRKLNSQETVRYSPCPNHCTISKSLGNTPTHGQAMALFTQKNVMGTLFETTERSETIGSTSSQPNAKLLLQISAFRARGDGYLWTRMYGGDFDHTPNPS